MKIKKIAALLISMLMLSVALSANANAPLQIDGYYNVSNVALTQPLVVNGSAKINGGSFEGGKINGSLKLMNAKVSGPITINGSLQADHSIFLSTTKINGSLRSTNSTFENNVTIASTKTLLDNTTTKNIFIQKSSNGFLFRNKTSKIYLNGKSVVNGNITFAQSGIVYVAQGSKITGKVMNGKVIAGKLS